MQQHVHTKRSWLFRYNIFQTSSSSSPAERVLHHSDQETGQDKWVTFSSPGEKWRWMWSGWSRLNEGQWLEGLEKSDHGVHHGDGYYDGLHPPNYPRLLLSPSPWSYWRDYCNCTRDCGSFDMLSPSGECSPCTASTNRGRGTPHSSRPCTPTSKTCGVERKNTVCRHTWRPRQARGPCHNGRKGLWRSKGRWRSRGGVQVHSVWFPNRSIGMEGGVGLNKLGTDIFDSMGTGWRTRRVSLCRRHHPPHWYFHSHPHHHHHWHLKAFSWLVAKLRHHCQDYFYHYGLCFY